MTTMPRWCTPRSKTLSLPCTAVRISLKHNNILLFPHERNLYSLPGPHFVTETQSFKQTHAAFHSRVQAKDLGTYVFCAVCGARLKQEVGTREGVVEDLESHPIGIELVATKLEDDDKLVRGST